MIFIIINVIDVTISIVVDQFLAITWDNARLIFNQKILLG